MTKYHGFQGYFATEDSGNTLRNISTDLTNVSLPRTVPTADTTGFGATDTSAVAGVKSATISIEGAYSDTADTGADIVMQGILGLLREFRYGPSGSTAGRRKYTGSAIWTNYAVTTPVGDKVGFTATGTVSGAISASTF